jgi:hypothetical protein
MNEPHYPKTIVRENRSGQQTLKKSPAPFHALKKLLVSVFRNNRTIFPFHYPDLFCLPPENQEGKDLFCIMFEKILVRFHPDRLWN